MTEFSTLLCLLLISLAVDAQRPISVELKRNEDRSVELSYRKQIPGSYVLELSCSRVDNCSDPSQLYSIQNFGGVLARLRPEDPQQPINLSYSYRYVRGVLRPSIDSTFCYLLPFSKSVRCEVRELSHLGSTYFGQEEPINWKAFEFICQAGDTVCAIRKGLVVEVKQDYLPDTTMHYRYTSHKNCVVVEHEDGSFARYEGFADGGVFPEPGDVVLPNQLIGTLMPYDKSGVYQLRLSIHFLVDFNFQTKENERLNEKKSRYQYINPVFETDRGLVQLEPFQHYQVVVNEHRVVAELSKKELKKWKEAQAADKF